MNCVVGSWSISELLPNVSSDYVHVEWPVTGECCCSTSASNDTAAWKEIVPKLKKMCYGLIGQCMCRKCFLADRAIHVPELQSLRKGCSKRTKCSW